MNYNAIQYEGILPIDNKNYSQILANSILYYTFDMIKIMFLEIFVGLINYTEMEFEDTMNTVFKIMLEVG